MLTMNQLDRYSRQITLDQIGVDGQQKLNMAKVLIIGAGALGAPSAIYLAAAGVGVIGIVDGDLVELSNLHRQIIHSEKTIGEKKAHSAKQFIQSLNSDIHVIEYDEYLDAKNAMGIIENYDLVINGSDNFGTRYLVNDACVFLKKPLIDASILRFEGTATVYYPGHGCYRCLFPIPPEDGAIPNCAEAGVIGALAGHMATLQVMEAIKLILGYHNESLIGKILCYDSLHAKHIVFTWSADPNCPVCGINPTIKTLSNVILHCSTETNMEVRKDADDTFDLQQLLIGSEEVLKFVLGENNIQLIDVREPHEYRKVHLDGSILYPLNMLLKDSSRLDSRKKTIVICQSGVRSLKAANHLRNNGFSDVSSLQGGIASWISKGHPVFSIKKKEE